MMWREDMQETLQVCGMICRILQVALQPLDFHAWHLLHICSISSAHGDEVLSQLLLARLACNVAFLGEMTLPRTRLLQVYRSYQKWSKLHGALHRSEKIMEDHVGARAPRVSAAPSGATWECDIAWFDLCVHLWFSGLLPTNNTSTIPDVVENLFFWRIHWVIKILIALTIPLWRVPYNSKW